MQLHPDDPNWGRERELLETYSLIGLGDWKEKKSQQDDFEIKMQIGDIVVIKCGSSLIALVEVTGKYKFIEKEKTGELDWFERRRKVKVLDWYRPEYDLFITPRGTLTRCNLDSNADSNNSIMRWYNKYLEVNQMNDIVKLLVANKNLILTGAPGTGKTFMANEIAKKMINTNLKKKLNPMEILNDLMTNYKVDFGSRKEKENLLYSFYRLFPKDKIQTLTLDQYCSGKGDRNNLCWWIENGLHSIGGYSPGLRGALVYGIYYSKEKQTYRKRDVFDGMKEEEVVNKITTSISNALESDDKVKEELQYKYYDAGFLLKILSSYKIEEFIPVHSLTHINNIIELFSISVPDKADQIDKSKALFNFYKKTIKNKDIKTYEFVSILYDNFNIKDGEIKNENQEISLIGETELVQFHPSYDYTDFVEGLRPKKENDNNEISFELKNGIFKDFCIKAKNNPNKNYVFLIDEINRGEISRIFGELFFSIDPGYRGIKGKVKTQYSNMQTEDTCFMDINDDYFYVPDNVYIIGTMNDIDRSVESFDFAMRRRFVWKEITANDSKNILDSEENRENIIIQQNKNEIISRMDKLNYSIENEIEGLNSHFQIGAAYFLKIKEYPDEPFEKLWNYHLKPLLSEYIRGMQDANMKMALLYEAYSSNN
jgi:5-methylcytosine-specific restriction enzyme B